MLHTLQRRPAHQQPSPVHRWPLQRVRRGPGGHAMAAGCPVGSSCTTARGPGLEHRSRSCSIGPGEQAESAETNPKIHSGGVSTRDGGARAGGVEDVAVSAPPTHPAQPVQVKGWQGLASLGQESPKEVLQGLFAALPGALQDCGWCREELEFRHRQHIGPGCWPYSG